VERRRLVLGWAGLAVGATLLVMGAAHSVAITSTALQERGELDARWMVLLALGWSLMAGSGVLAVASWLLLRGSAAAAWVALGAASFMLIETGIVAAAFSPGPAALFAGYLALWWFLGRPRVRPALSA